MSRASRQSNRLGEAQELELTALLRSHSHESGCSRCAQVSLSIVIARLTGNYGRWASGVPASGQPTEYCN